MMLMAELLVLQLLIPLGLLSWLAFDGLAAVRDGCSGSFWWAATR